MQLRGKARERVRDCVYNTSMAHGFNVEYEIIQGETPTLLIEFLQEDGQPFDITGATITITSKRLLEDTDFLFQRPLTITDGKKGLGKVKLTTADTGVDGTVFIEARIVFDSDGTVIKPKRGQVSLHIERSLTGAV